MNQTVSGYIEWVFKANSLSLLIQSSDEQIALVQNLVPL